MSFDQEPDGDIHGECANEIRQLEARVKELEGGIKSALSWVESSHRPPVQEEFPAGKMVLIRLHALVGLHMLVNKDGGKEVSEGDALITASKEHALPERDTSKPVERQGLFHKFNVQRVDGSDKEGGKHHGCAYFVLDLDHDQHAAAALRAYAHSCKNTHPELSADLVERYGVEPVQEPVGYFKIIHGRWVEVAKTTDGAIALYDKPQPDRVATPVQEPVAWSEALRISELEPVADALQNFSNDSTEDNAVGLVIAVLSAATKQPDRVAELESSRDSWKEIAAASIKKENDLHARVVELEAEITALKAQVIAPEVRVSVLDFLKDANEGAFNDVPAEWLSKAIAAPEGKKP